MVVRFFKTFSQNKVHEPLIKAFMKLLRVTVLMTVVLMVGGVVWGQTTYTWQGANGSWATAANWNPTRTIPANNDILIFNNVTCSPTNVPTQTIGKLQLINNAIVTLMPSNGGNRTLSVNSTATDAINIPSGNILTISGETINNRNLTISFSSTGTANISGTVRVIDNGGTAFLTNGTGTINFNSGSSYEHARDGGTIPTATWAVSSTCNLTGITGNVPGGLAQNFGNFTWNCTGQNANLDFTNNLTTVNGNLSIINTGANRVNLFSSGTTLNILGNLTIGDGTSNATVRLSSTNGAATNTINLYGNFTFYANASLTNRNAGNILNFYFAKTGLQTFTNTGGVIPANPLNFTVNSGSILDMGTSVLNGSTGTFTLSSGAGIITQHTQGISTTAATGCIQVTGAKTYNTGADYTYNGTVSQATGNGLPATVHNLTIANTAVNGTVTLTNSTSVSGTLTLNSGILTIGTNDITLANGASLAGNAPSASNMVATGTGRFFKYFPIGDSPAFTFPVGDVTGTTEYSPVTLDFSANTAAGTVGVSVTNATHPSINTGGTATSYLSRYWTYATTGLTNYTYNASTYQYNASDINGTEALMKLSYWNGAAWTTIANSNASANSLSISSALTQATGLLNGNAFTGRYIMPTFYSSGNTDPSNVNNWWSNTNGTGSHPVDFITSNQKFIIQNGHTMTTGAGWTISGTNTTLEIQNGGTLSETTAISISANTTLQVNNGGTLNHNVNSISIFGGTESFGNTSTINYGFAGTQDVVIATYGNLTISGSGTKTLQGNITPAGNLTVTGSTFDLGSFTANRSLAGGTLSIDATSTLLIGGTNTFPANYTTNTLTAGSIVNYNGTAQTVVNITYSNLTISGSGIKTLGGNTIVNSNLTLTSGTLAVDANTLTLNGPAIAGTPNNLSTTAASTLAFGGSSAGITVPSSVTLLNNLTINNANGVSLTGALSSGTLTLSSGILSTTATNLLTITNTATGSIGGASATNYINGPLARTLLAGIAADGTTYSFPVGDGANYRPLDLVNIRTGGTSPVVMVSETGTGALNGDETTITGIASRNWYVQTVSGNFTSAYIRLTESGLDFTKTIGKSTAQAGIYTSAGGTGIGANITTASAITSATLPAYFAIGTTVVKTYYSYQSGDWKSANTWTIDPSGTLWINAAVPTAADNVVILNGRTVTIYEDGKNSLSLEIRLGGNLDLQGTGTVTPHNFGIVTGQGTLKLSSGNFPGGTYNDFVASDGGTVEYYNYTGSLSTTQTTYNNLLLTKNNNNATNYIMTLASDMLLNGNLIVNRTQGTGTITFTIGNNATIRNITINGNVTNNTGCFIGVGVFNAIHTINLYGNFTNNGSVRFTNQASPVVVAYYTAAATATGAAVVTFMGGSDNSLACNGVTDFYRLIIDKGSDQTYTLDVTSTNIANFALYAPNNQGGNVFDCGLNCFGTGVYLKALYIAHGTLKLNDNINIPSLTEGGQDFNILPPAALWVNGATVSTTVVGQNGTGYQAATLYGKLRISSGTFSTGDAAGIVLGQSGTPDIIVEGTGTFDVSQVWTSTGSNIMSYTQTGGTTNIRATGESHAAPMFSLTSANCVFDMSGGTLNFMNAIFNGTQGIDIRVASGQYSVTGGTVNINYPGGVTCDINSTVPFYNLNVLRQSGGGTTTARFLNTSSTNIAILNNLTLNANTTLDAGTNTVGLTVGKDFAMDATSTYTPGINTTTFNGNGGQVFTNAGTITTGLNNFILSNTSNTNITNNLSVRGYLTISNTCFLNDQGNSISVAGDVTNSGTHTSTGTGAIILNGAGVQTVGGSGSGVFGNFTVNKTGSSAILSANQSVTGNLRLVNRILDINRYNLVLSANSNIYDVAAGTPAPTTFGNAKMITTTGQQSDGGLTKTFNATGSFLYPIGTTAYHPGTITISQAPATWGDVTVKPVAKAHPFAITGNEVLTYYWKVTTNLITGIQPGSISHTYNYAGTQGPSENTYITGVYYPYSWTKGAAAQVDKIAKNIIFPSIGKLDGDYTAGVTAAFGPVLVYYSHHSGDWDTQSTWSNVDNNPLSADATTFPSADDPVVIGDGGSNNHIVTVSANNKTVGGLQISTGSTLDIKATTGHNFGALPDLKISGTGTLRISSDVTPAAFPSGDFGNFLGPNGGTVEYYTQTAPSAIGAVAFTLPTTYTSSVVTTITNYCNLILSPATGRNITMPNTDLVVYKDFNINVSGTSATGIAQLNNQNTTHTVTIDGNLNVNNGNLQYTNGGNTAQNIVVKGDVNISGGTIFDVANANAATNALSIQGDLTNNGTFDMFTTAARICNVTFTGAANKQIKGTTAVRTDFNILTVNKGIDRNSILEATVNALSLNTALATALTLSNGTFRLSSPIGSPITITLTTTSPFTIPITGCLSANIGTINIGAANDNNGDLMLQGRLEVMNAGIVNIGNAGGSNNDIEYAAAGNPEINISGGSLNVDGQIRRNTSNTLGSLWFNQSGGSITIKGNGFNNTRGMFELVNTGSQFNVSGGNLIIQRAGSVTYADVYIMPETSNVSGSNGGHTLVIGNTSTPAAQIFNLNISAPLWNLTVDGTTNNKTASLSVNTLSVLHNLTINGNGVAGTGSVFKANDLNVTIGGSLTNNNLSAALGANQGGYQAGAAGSTQNTTFTGTGQINGTGINLTNFANLIIGSASTTPSLTLGSNSKLQVNENLTLISGTLSDAGNIITVLGNIDNSATHSSPAAPVGGIVLSSGNKQLLSGNGNGRYGNITINNATGVDMTSNNLISGQLSLTGGLLYIDDYKLTMDVNASFSGSYDAKHMIELNGVLSDAGVLKLFSGSTANFVFPIGTNGKYRPATYTLTSFSAGSIKVVPVNMAHPVDNAPANDQLNYYWKVTTTGFGGLTASTQVYQYGTAEITGNESNYHGALYNNFAWSDYGTSVINTATHTINITRSDLLAGEYTAGEAANFSDIHKLYSLKTSTWTDPTAWAEDLPTNGTCNCTPNGNPVFIQPTHKITMNINNAYAYSVNIEGTLDLVSTSFHNLGYIIDTLHAGTGRMMLQATTDGMFLFPGGNYDRFMASPGTTIEFYGNTNATLPLKPGNIYKPYQNVDLTDAGIKYMSAENLKIIGNLTINNGAKLNNTLFNKSLYILGNWTDKNTVSGGFVPGTGLTSFEGSSAQTLTMTNAVTENYYDLKVNNLLGLTLAGLGNVQVSDKLYLTGGAITSNITNSLTLTNSSTSAVVGGSVNSFVDGPLRKQISNGSFFTFPVGKSPSRYGNVYLFNIVNAGIWQAEYFNNDPTANVPSLDKNSKKLPISHVSANEYWRIIGAAGGSGRVQLRWDANSGYAGSSLSTRSKIRVVEWNPAGTPQWEYKGKVLNDGGPISGTVTTDAIISLAPGTDLHYLTIGDEGLPTATITSALTASICNDAITSTAITVALTGTPPWSLTYKLGTVSTTLNNIASSPVSIVLTSASPGITQPIIANTLFNFNITNVNDLTGSPGTTDYVTTVALTVKPVPTNTITGKTSVGTGEIVAYSTPTDASTYAWTLSSNGNPLTGSTDTYTVTWGGATPGPYTIGLTKTAANGCQSTNSISVTTSTTPTPVINGNQYVCANSTGNVYFTPNVAGHSYTWSLPAGGGSITAGGSTYSCTVTWNSAATGNTVQVHEYVTATPAVFTDATLAVDIGIQPSDNTPSYSAPASVCNGGTAAITVNGSENNVRYQLRLNSDNSNVGTAVDGNGGAIMLNTTAIAANTTFNIYAYTLAPFNCSTQLTNPAATFTLNALPVLNYGTLASGNQTICNGIIPDAIAFSTSPSGGAGTYNYEWYSYNGLAGACPTGTTIPAGWTLIAGAASDTYTPPSLASSTSFAVMVTPTGSPVCGTTTWASGCRQVTVNIKPNASILSGNTTTCAGTTGEGFSVTNNAAWTYAWAIEDNVGTVNAPVNTAAVTIDWKNNAFIFVGPLATAASVTKKVTATVNTNPANGCPTTLEWNVTIDRLPETGPAYYVPN
jgi:fibronectin-binding autotransporter adhesin